MERMLTVQRHRLSERWANTQDDAGHDVLKAGEQEQGSVLRIDNVALLQV